MRTAPPAVCLSRLRAACGERARPPVRSGSDSAHSSRGIRVRDHPDPASGEREKIRSPCRPGSDENRRGRQCKWISARTVPRGPHGPCRSVRARLIENAIQHPVGKVVYERLEMGEAARTREGGRKTALLEIGNIVVLGNGSVPALVIALDDLV